MNKTGLIFDVDGTLWDSSYRVAESWNNVFLRHDDIKTDCNRDKIMSVMGKTMTDIADIFFPDLDDDKKLTYLKECEDYELEYLKDNPPKPFDGVYDVVKKLSEKYPLFILSNCQSGYIELFMNICGISNYITDIECFGNNHKSKSENIRLLSERNCIDNYYYIGDIQSDYNATIEAGGRFIHAAYGFGTIDAVVPKIDNIYDILSLIEELESARKNNE